MSLTLPSLPYALDALEPHISRRTLAAHHGHHHAAYVEKTRALVQRYTTGIRLTGGVVRSSASKDEASLQCGRASVEPCVLLAVHAPRRRWRSEGGHRAVDQDQLWQSEGLQPTIRHGSR